MFLLIKKLDFVSTGELGQNNYKVFTNNCRSIHKNGMFSKAHDLILKKMRDKTVRRVYKTIGLATQILHKIHRFNINFNVIEPRLNNIRSIPKLKSKVQNNHSLLIKIDAIARYIIASLFYFKLNSFL